MNKQFRNYLQNTFIFLDLTILNVFFVLFLFVFERVISQEYITAYLKFWIVLNVSWIMLILMTRTYSEGIITRFEFFMKRTVQVYILWIIVMMFYLFFSRQFLVSRFFILINITGFGVGLLINRFIYLGVHNYFKGKNNLFNNVIIIGYNDTAKKLENYFEEEGLNVNLLGFVEDSNNVRELSRHPILSDINRTMEIAKEMDVQEIFSTITPEQDHFIYQLMNEAERECIRFKVVPDLSVFINKPVVIDYIRDLPILSMRSEPLDDVGNRIKKRVVDVTVSLLVVIFILSWMVPILAILILLESKGPVFFSQLRSGRNNKTFYCFKFRSMRVNQDADSKQATKNDSRVTRLGAFLRKTSLDEFPQFINVLRGEMSLVGPRPHMVKHTVDYSRLVDQYMIRQFLKPGITGWAQINGYRGEITDHEHLKNRVSNDLWYLENWNIWLDIRIMFLTVYKVIKGDAQAF